jgi:DNA primase
LFCSNKSQSNNMEIKDIKKQLSIIALLQHYGIKLQRGKQIHCPFHDDKTPSMQVYEERNSLYCHSSNCKHGGKHIDVIDFIMFMDGCTKHQAILKAKQLLNYIPTTKQATLTIQQHTNTNYNNSNNMQQQETNYNELFVRLQKTYVASRQAQDYAASRNINHVCLELGFNTAASKVVSGMRNCIVFPLRDGSGNIVSLYGRSITPETPNGEGLHYYTKNRTGLYHNANSETTTLVLTESIIDSATLMVHTDYHTLALFGTNGFTDEHKTLLQSLQNLSEVILFFDGDEAGKQAVVKHSEAIQQLVPGIKISSVITPDDEDINSLTISHEPTILNHLIQNRTFLFSSRDGFGTGAENKNNTDLNYVHANNSNGSNNNLSTYITPVLNTDNENFPFLEFENMLYTAMGGVTKYPLDRMKITLELKRTDSLNILHKIRQQVDLYNDEALQRFLRNASEKLELGSKQLQYGVTVFTELLDAFRKGQIATEQQAKDDRKKTVVSQKAMDEASRVLSSQKLLKVINTIIGNTGIVGEEKNRLIMWLIFCTRMQEKPLHIICLGASGTGKTYLQDGISALIPEQFKRSFTSASAQSFYYVKRNELKNQLILVEDMDGADAILYVIRELQTKALVCKLVPMKDPHKKDEWTTKNIIVEGPISLSGTTTKERIYEDNANRCILIYLDTSMEQQHRIMDRQCMLSADEIDLEAEAWNKEVMLAIQFLLRPIKVVNRFATMLRLPDSVFKPLRTNDHYIKFVEAVTLVHQCQREIKIDKYGKEYIETSIEDIEMANELMKDVLLSKSDELTKACRDFLECIKTWLDKNRKPSFFKSDVRTWMRINPDNLRHYLSTLHKYGYIKIVGGNKHKTGYEYEIVNKHEYDNLRKGIETALDKALNDIKTDIKQAS